MSVSTIVTKNAQTRIFDPSAMLFKTWPANSPAQDARFDMADVMALKMPDPVRKIITNFAPPHTHRIDRVRSIHIFYTTR
ncbi:hypothetical protein [Hyphomonas sp.]|uniref:hypothetical protein n=1 Tax=Hyphomonas sp. TaxID=87 RepID=UPI0039E5FE70